MSCNGGPGDIEFEFIESVRDCFWYQHVDDYTRGRGQDRPSILDLIFSNEEDMISDVEILGPVGRSDHSFITFNFNGYAEHHHEKIRYNFNKADFYGMRQYLDIDWDLELRDKDVEAKWKVFTDHYHSAVEKFVPKKSVKNSSKQWKVPISNNLKTLIKRQDRLWHKYRRTKTEADRVEYNQVRNQVRRLSRNAVKLHEKFIADNVKSNPKGFWNYVSKKSKTKSSIPDLYVDDNKQNLTKSDIEKSNVLGDFFASVFTDEPSDDLPDITIKDVPVCDSIVMSVEKVEKLLKELKVNKSPGPDGVSARVLKELSDILAVPLYNIFQCSIQSAKIPEDWRTANITALFKKGDKKYAGNYRPVSLTCIICKVLESIIRENIIIHMKSHKLFSERQFGFISGRSTVLQLINVLDSWTGILEEGGSVDVAYCDYMKAFDKIPHRRLLHKLRIYNFGDNYINWIKCFLENRKQRVIVNGEKSVYRDVSSGVPQGSVLGPVLFVLFINDLEEALTCGSELYLYADDTKLYRDIKSEHDRELLQQDIYNMYDWSQKWLLRFHPDKCVVMNVGNNNLPQKKYKLSNELPYMKSSDCEKDIGVYIDSRLTFEKHMNEKINKTNTIVGMMKRSFEHIDKSTFKLIYTGLVRPHLEYANAVWCPYKKKDIRVIENVQRRATRLIPGFKEFTYEERLRRLNLPTLRYRRIRGDMIEVFKLMNDKYDFDSTKLFTIRNNSTTRGHSCKIYKERARLNVRKFSFTQRVCNVWNSLPDHVVSARTVLAFEKRLDRHWSNQEVRFNFEAELGSVEQATELAGEAVEA